MRVLLHILILVGAIIGCAVGLLDIVTGLLILPHAIFGWFLLIVSGVIARHSDELSGAIIALFQPTVSSSAAPQQSAPQSASTQPEPQSASTQPEPQPAQVGPIADAIDTGIAVTLAELKLLEMDIEAKRHQLAAGVDVAQKQNLARQAAANAEASQLKAIASKVPNAA